MQTQIEYHVEPGVRDFRLIAKTSRGVHVSRISRLEWSYLAEELPWRPPSYEETVWGLIIYTITRPLRGEILT